MCAAVKSQRERLIQKGKPALHLLAPSCTAELKPAMAGRGEGAAYPWHTEGQDPGAGGYSAAGYQNARAGGRVGVADWESVSVHSDLDKSLSQDATQMHGLNSK